MFQESTVSLSAATIIGVLTIAGSVVANWLTSRAAAARFEGSIGARIDATDKNIERIEGEQRDQWTSINRNGADIARVEGAMNAHRASKAMTAHG